MTAVRPQLELVHPRRARSALPETYRWIAATIVSALVALMGAAVIGAVFAGCGPPLWSGTTVETAWYREEQRCTQVTRLDGREVARVVATRCTFPAGTP